MKSCFSCKKELDISERPGRRDTCPFCRADLKVCLNCRFYDEGAYNKCREPRAERVVEKDRANFCDYFEFRESEGGKAISRAEEARRRLEELFKKP
jgi:hypothetical protein